MNGCIRRRNDSAWVVTLFFFFLKSAVVAWGRGLLWLSSYFLLSLHRSLILLFFCLGVKQTKVGPRFNFSAMILSHAVLYDAVAVSVFYWMEYGDVRCTLTLLGELGFFNFNYFRRGSYTLHLNLKYYRIYLSHICIYTTAYFKADFFFFFFWKSIFFLKERKAY